VLQGFAIGDADRTLSFDHTRGGTARHTIGTDEDGNWIVTLVVLGHDWFPSLIGSFLSVTKSNLSEPNPLQN
jgi:hypothetical protein